MKKIGFIYLSVALVAASIAVKAQNYTTPFTPTNLLPESIYDLIVGESSGEQAYYHVMELAPYEKNRTPEEYRGDLHETKYVYGKLKEYGLPNAAVERIGKATTWDGVKASLWEISPKRAKIADYEDLAAYLAQGSANADVETQLVWIGRGSTREELADVKGKIVVTEVAGARIQGDVDKAGAVGIISFYSPRPLVDPIQVPNAGIRPGTSLFCFNLPPRDGYALRDRLLAGETITVQAKVETTETETDNQIPTCLIPGADPNAGEIIITAHLFEGYVKLGANDNNSGAAAILDMARTLNKLIVAGSIPRPKRSIRFLWIPEISGSAAWIGRHKDLVPKTLCCLNLDMVGLWLSKSESLFCFQRTTMGNPHYINDVTESMFHYVGATNKQFLATGAGRPEPLKPIFSVTGSHDPFYYAVSAHYGSSDHEIFNDFGVNIPALMLITWPDNYYHTSGDRPSILDPTQLRRATVIAAATAYAIASADEDGALKIAAEVSTNAVKRMALIQQSNANRINSASADDLPAACKRAVFDLDAFTVHEKATLSSVLELAPSGSILKKYIDTQIAHIQSINKIGVKSLEDLAKARGEALHVAVKPVALTPEEQKAARIYPKATSLAFETGYGALRTIPHETLTKHGIMTMTFGRGGAEVTVQRGIRIINGAEIARLTVSGNNSVLDIKKMLDAQFPATESLADITQYLEMLKDAGFVTY
ncbi:MAG: DUF4910 domain-containing protein [Tannerella sp.]|jgi:hypothetical protein|nr:DUF4910 domain-containing protein [Tannerella sp.]